MFEEKYNQIIERFNRIKFDNIEIFRENIILFHNENNEHIYIEVSENSISYLNRLQNGETTNANINRNGNIDCSYNTPEHWSIPMIIVNKIDFLENILEKMRSPNIQNPSQTIKADSNSIKSVQNSERNI